MKYQKTYLQKIYKYLKNCFIIDKEGAIEKLYKEVKTKNHINGILSCLNAEYIFKK